ncbi:MAG: hypothetical protein JSV52_09120 [Candidatus Zixiibacteriota bacterium]|nr:MAG: hypothetical protein JSV52_09120 [candidate division Zixibacteria bacterium]
MMARLEITPKRALILFIAIIVVLIGQAVWWIIFMARLVDEKVRMAVDLGASQNFVDLVHQQEIRRQIMIGSEGLFMLVLVFVGAWLIYRALVRAEELKFQQQNFLMAVTHELKTPLASIKIYLDTLESNRVAPEKKAQIIPRVKEDARRLEKLVENVLEAGRFDRGGYDFNRERFNLSQLVAESLGRFDNYPSEIPLHVTKHRFEPSLEIYADRAAIKRAIETVLENAIIYNDKKAIELGIRLYRDDDRIVLGISDNGMGLLKKDVGRIFDRFYRVGEEINRSRPGTGLGLYLCREIIRAHSGKISARSDGPGKGTEFTIKLKANINDEENIAR